MQQVLFIDCLQLPQVRFLVDEAITLHFLLLGNLVADFRDSVLPVLIVATEHALVKSQVLVIL